LSPGLIVVGSFEVSPKPGSAALQGYDWRVADPLRSPPRADRATERARVGYEAYGPIAEAVMASEHRFTHEQPEGILAFLELGRELNVRRPRRSETRQARGDAAVSVRLEPGPSRLGTEFMWLILWLTRVI
jgi:hypothetical protein